MDKETENKLIKDRLYFYMEKENLNTNQLANLANITQSSLNSIVNRPSVPTISTLRKICEGLNISVTEFLDFPPYNETKKKNLSNLSETELIQELANMNNEIESLKVIINKFKQEEEKTG